MNLSKRIIIISIAFYTAILFLPARAQSDHYNRCAWSGTESTRQFEDWLHSKRVSVARASAMIYKVPVVVHILHRGETIGEGLNHSAERIQRQIRTLNEDFRRKKGTPGFNSHPDGGDAGIEFVLAKIDPQGNATDGIVRVDINSVDPPPLPPDEGDIITHCSRYSYWNPEQYLNIWSMDIGSVILGSGRYPVSDLEGLPTQHVDGDGVLISAFYFGQGETNTVPNYDMGRTLTHEIGHFLGLLHTFGALGDCNLYSDYCDDTPPIGASTGGCPSEKPIACDGRPAMIENYMDYSYDRCMNIFTNDQIARMHIVLESSPRRKSLLTSPGLGQPDDIIQVFKIYPNPVTDKLYIVADEKVLGQAIKVTAHTLLGKMMFEKSIKMTATEIEVIISIVHEKVIILTIECPGSSHRQLIIFN